MTASRVIPSRMPGVDRRRVQLAPSDDEDVVAGAFGHFALVVEHQGFEAAGVGPLDLGQDVVEVVQRLDPRVQRRGWLRIVPAVMIFRPFSYSSGG